MAPTTYTLRRGDNIWSLANGNYGADYRNAIPGNTTNAKMNNLISINNIKNTRTMPVGYVVYLNEAAKSGTSSSASSSSNANTLNKPNITILGMQSESTTGRDFFASWTWGWDHTAEYTIRWEWDYNGETKSQTSTTKDTWSTFTIPEEFQKTANWVQIFVTPVPETYESKDGAGNATQVSYWAGKNFSGVGKKYNIADNPPLKLSSAPDVEINTETLVLTASYSNIVASDLDAVSVKFNIVQDNKTSLGDIGPVTINTESNYVAGQRTVERGHSYTVRACTVGANGKTSGWTDFSGPEETQPSAPTNLTVRRDTHVDEENDIKSYSVFLEWSPVANADKYTVEYTNIERNFNTAGATINSQTTENSTPSIRIGINSEDLGYTYYFRVKAVNGELTSEPSEIVKLPIGVPPGPPSTWSTSDSAFAGETTYYQDEDGVQQVDTTPMELNWTHQPSDNSKQTFAQLSFNFNDEKDAKGEFVWNDTEIILNSTDVNDKDEKVQKCVYGTAVSYKGNLYFKMDTNHPDFKNAKIRWKARTAGVTDILSNDSWSVDRTIHIYEKPTLGLSMTSDIAGTGSLITTLTSFPFYVRGTLLITDYKIQRPVGYHVQVISNNYYVTVDDVGRTKIVNPGDAVYSKYFNTSSNPLVVEMSANNIDLESSIEYTLQCTADMSTGLAVTNQYNFTVSWVDVEHAINADISVDTDAYTALITPYCRERVGSGKPAGKNILPYPYTNIKVTSHSVSFETQEDRSIVASGTPTGSSGITVYEGPLLTTGICTFSISGEYTNLTGQFSLHNESGDALVVKQQASILTIDVSKHPTAVTMRLIVKRDVNDVEVNGKIWPQLEIGASATEYEEYYETYEDGDLVENVTLSVYRREYDGTYKEIATGIPNNYTAVTDPHPALDYARYRFTAKDTRTGALSVWDMPGFPIKSSDVILQWAEEWSTFDGGEATTIEGPSWSGSLLKLSYNIKVSDKRKRDVTLVSYAGRERKVSYYGTQVDETSQWSMDIPADDVDTIYALRRLSLWSGDVYVREPSGMGFWANVNVSFNQSYNGAVTVPVTLDITRVEGGV